LPNRAPARLTLNHKQLPKSVAPRRPYISRRYCSKNGIPNIPIDAPLIAEAVANETQLEWK
jgi:hypothetical protein